MQNGMTEEFQARWDKFDQLKKSRILLFIYAETPKNQEAARHIRAMTLSCFSIEHEFFHWFVLFLSFFCFLTSFPYRIIENFLSTMDRANLTTSDVGSKETRFNMANEEFQEDLRFLRELNIYGEERAQLLKLYIQVDRECCTQLLLKGIKRRVKGYFKHKIKGLTHLGSKTVIWSQDLTGARFPHVLTLTRFCAFCYRGCIPFSSMISQDAGLEGKRCGGCRNAYYCNRLCMRDHYKIHVKDCYKLKKKRQAVAMVEAKFPGLELIVNATQLAFNRKYMIETNRQLINRFGFVI